MLKKLTLCGGAYVKGDPIDEEDMQDV